MHPASGIAYPVAAIVIAVLVLREAMEAWQGEDGAPAAVD